MLTRQQLKERRQHGQVLKQAGFSRHWAVRYIPWLLISITVVAAIVVGILMQSQTGRDGVQAAAGLVAFGAVIAGYWQWMQARHEIAFDKFYERLNLANQRLDTWPAARGLINPLWSGDAGRDQFHREMYVFTELDNLEYAIEKYKLGYMSTTNAYRALETFMARCRPSRDFCEAALRLVRGNNGYTETTIKVVEAVVEQALQDLHEPNVGEGGGLPCEAVVGKAPQDVNGQPAAAQEPDPNLEANRHQPAA